MILRKCRFENFFYGIKENYLWQVFFLRNCGYLFVRHFLDRKRVSEQFSCWNVIYPFHYFICYIFPWSFFLSNPKICLCQIFYMLFRKPPHPCKFCFVVFITFTSSISHCMFAINNVPNKNHCTVIKMYPFLLVPLSGNMNVDVCKCTYVLREDWG